MYSEPVGTTNSYSMAHVRIAQFRQNARMMQDMIRNRRMQIARMADTLDDDFIPFDEPVTQSIPTVVTQFAVTDDDLTCGICLDLKNVLDICKLGCDHKFCISCVKQVLNREGINTCAMCRCPITEISTLSDNSRNLIKNNK